MAYSFIDLYRPLRFALRVQGSTTGLGLGTLLALTPQPALAQWGIYTAPEIWPIRLVGIQLITMGLIFLNLAKEPFIRTAYLFAITFGNSAIAIVLLFAYFRQEFVQVSNLGQWGLVLIIFLCLIGAVVPLRYLRVEDRY